MTRDTSATHRSSRAKHLMIGLFAGAGAFALVSDAGAQCGAPPAFDNEAGGPTRPADSVPEDSALPSTLVYYVHAQNYLQPEWDQQTIAWPLMALTRKTDLDDKERFFWGQLNFMSFKAQEAYDIFGEFTDRDDWYGWIARQRQAIMDTRAFENFERLERNVAYERENFAFDPEFASITGFGERALCRHWAANGEHERAVNLAVETINATPRDAAYRPLYLVGACFDSFEETERRQEAIELAESIRADMAAALKKREKDASNRPAYDPDLYENIIEDRWYGRSLLAPYNYTSHQIEQLISWYDRFLACNRDQQKEACPS